MTNTEKIFIPWNVVYIFLAIMLVALFAIFISWVIFQIRDIGEISNLSRSSYTASIKTFIIKKPPEATKEDIIIIKSFNTVVTAFNTVVAQTDASPCIASGGNICGRLDVVACPRNIPLFSWVRIEGKKYQCLDRTSNKYNGRFDISFDKDIQAAKQFGKRNIIVEIID